MKRIIRQAVSWVVFTPMFLVGAGILILVTLIRPDSLMLEKLVCAMGDLVERHDKWLLGKAEP